MKKILLLAFCMCSLFFANAQNSPAIILQKTLDKNGGEWLWGHSQRDIQVKQKSDELYTPIAFSS